MAGPTDLQMAGAIVMIIVVFVLAVIFSRYWRPKATEAGKGQPTGIAKG
ncbi:MAG TPA: hypothetical protein VE955_04925 [Candidatus Dormibacteraeota bacterium]|jgi:hypothetical protein|nr:hypothetical protein [Candidatus Dormibacteraeota bacterium]